MPLTYWEFNPHFTLESWESGKIRDTSRSTAWIDPKNRDTQSEEWKDYILVVEDKELYPNISQLAHISQVFRKIFQEHFKTIEAKKDKLKELNELKEVKESRQGKRNVTGKGNLPVIPNRPLRAGPAGQLQLQSIDESIDQLQQNQVILAEDQYQDVYDFLIAIQPQSLLPHSARDSNTIVSENVVRLAAFARKYEVEFLWDECLIFLRQDINADNVLRHYSVIRQRKVVELEEIVFQLCIDLLQKSAREIAQVFEDSYYRNLDYDARVHLKIVLEKVRRCVQCHSDQFPWRVQISCPKCKDPKLFTHRMCDTLSQEFARLNRCQRCHNKITDVQWIWGGDSFESSPHMDEKSKPTK